MVYIFQFNQVTHNLKRTTNQLLMPTSVCFFLVVDSVTDSSHNSVPLKITFDAKRKNYQWGFDLTRPCPNLHLN